MAVQYKAKDVAKAIREARGIISDAARSLGCDRSTIYRKIKKYSTVEEAYEEANERQKDEAEGKLLDLLDDAGHKDHFKAVRFYLRTKAKDRGYTEKQEVDLAGGVELRVTYADPDD